MWIKAKEENGETFTREDKVVRDRNDGLKVRASWAFEFFPFVCENSIPYLEWLEPG